MQHLMALLLQLSDKIGEVTLFVKGTRRWSFFFMKHTQICRCYWSMDSKSRTYGFSTSGRIKVRYGRDGFTYNPFSGCTSNPFRWQQRISGTPSSCPTINNSLKDQQGYTSFSFNLCHTSLWTHLNSHVWPKAGWSHILRGLKVEVQFFHSYHML